MLFLIICSFLSAATRSSSKKYAIILVNNDCLEDVLRSSTWFAMDGTFRTTPRTGNVLDLRASQVLHITADYHGSVVLLFSVVMTSRKVGLYKKVFKFIKSQIPGFKPPQIMADYERAMRSAFKSVFPTSRVFGCRFHYSKNLFAKIKSKFRLAGYLRPTGSEHQKQISHRLRQYFAMPLLKPEDMQPQMNRLKDEMKALVLAHCTPEEQKSFNALHNYIIKTWMIRYGPEEISVFGAIHKTNNVTERYPFIYFINAFN